MPNTVTDQQMAEFNALAPGQSFPNRERAWMNSLSGGLLGLSTNDMKSAIFSGPGVSIANGELNKWITLANITYTLGLPTTLSVTDYRMAVLAAGGPI